MVGLFDFNAAVMNASGIMVIPVQQPWSQRSRSGRALRSNSASRADRLASPRSFGHLRTSSGSRLSHETSLHAGRAAHAAADAASGQKSPPGSVASPKLSSSAGSSTQPSPFHDDRRASSMNAASAAGSVSSASGTMASDPTSLANRDSLLASRPFVARNGRQYLNDTTLPYPLPFDLAELHRQSLRTLLLIQLFGAPVCSPSLTKRPPQRVLEIGCGAGFWSTMCHRYYKGRGHSGISFTGIDIAPLCPGSAGVAAGAAKPDHDMKWTFISHDLREFPWPLPKEEFDLVMVKDMSLAVQSVKHHEFIEEYLRRLRPGGTLEIWESDHLIRMLKPQVPDSGRTGDADELEAATSLGAYAMSANTPLSAPLNPYLVEYNNWISQGLKSRDLNAVPCALVGSALLQEPEIVDIGSRRLAIPLGEVRWERQGVGAGATNDSNPSAEERGESVPPPRMGQRALTAGQIALRTTALLTLVQQVQALESMLREASSKSQDEWDVWLGKMMSDLVSESGASSGECLEVGAWWAKKKSNGQDG